MLCQGSGWPHCDTLKPTFPSFEFHRKSGEGVGRAAGSSGCRRWLTRVDASDARCHQPTKAACCQGILRAGVMQQHADTADAEQQCVHGMLHTWFATDCSRPRTHSKLLKVSALLYQ